MTETFDSVCPLDCPGACALKITTENHKIVTITGNPDHPCTQGVICGKVSRYHEIQAGPRITDPMIRTGPKGTGTFETTSWDHALDLIATKLQEAIHRFGPESVLPFSYGGTMGVIQRRAYARLTARAGFSELEKSICYSIGWAGWQAGVGKAIGPDPAELAASDLPILWGINAAATHISLMNFVKRARKKGAPLIVVDPYRNHTAKLADLHIALRPGTDGALAVAIMHVLLAQGWADLDYLAQYTDFDHDIQRHLEARSPAWAAPITGLSVAEIETFAHLIGQAKAPFIRLGLGMSRQNNGAVNLHAVSCLPAMTGAWTKPGGGALFATGDAFNLSTQPMPIPTAEQQNSQPPRILDMSRLGEHLTNPNLSPPIAALLISHANPAGSCPNLQRVWLGLARDDLFTVVHEQVMTDTARFADLLLPATTFLEHEDLYKSYGQYTLQHAAPIFPPLGQAKSNHAFVNALARRLGYEDEPFQLDEKTTIKRVLQESNLPDWQIWKETWLNCAPTWREQHFLDGFPQPDKRFHFRPNWSNAEMPRLPDHWPVNHRDDPKEAKAYPLDFMTPPAIELLNTTFTSSHKVMQRLGIPCLWINPEDAEPRQIHEGDKVVVYNGQGKLTMIAKVTTDVRPGLTLCESNPPGSSFKEGISLNALTHSQPTAPNGGPAFHDNRVEVAVLP